MKTYTFRVAEFPDRDHVVFAWNRHRPGEVGQEWGRSVEHPQQKRNLAAVVSRNFGAQLAYTACNRRRVEENLANHADRKDGGTKKNRDEVTGVGLRRKRQRFRCVVARRFENFQSETRPAERRRCGVDPAAGAFGNGTYDRQSDTSSRRHDRSRSARAKIENVAHLVRRHSGTIVIDEKLDKRFALRYADANASIHTAVLARVFEEIHDRVHARIGRDTRNDRRHGRLDRYVPLRRNGRKHIDRCVHDSREVTGSAHRTVRRKVEQ